MARSDLGYAVQLATDTTDCPNIKLISDFARISKYE